MVEDGRVLLARNIAAEGRSRAFAGGASVPVTRLAELAEPLVAVHGQSDQHRLLRPAAQRDALDRFGGARLEKLLKQWRETHRTLREVEAELDDTVNHARERAQEADLLRFGLEEIEAVGPVPGEDADLAAEESRLSFADTLRAAAEQAREALSAEEEAPDALGAVGVARRLLDGVRDHDPDVAALSDRLAEVNYLLADVAAERGVLRCRYRHRSPPTGRSLRAARGVDGAHPQVRRDDRRGAGLGRAGQQATARPGPDRRPGRGTAGSPLRAALGAGRHRDGPVEAAHQGRH
ncbi:hypothetical protein [Nocardioides alcanivorans]|uniref:hypothetical protein n=1 Tax=Nocardioides alcanivorans TaxID=2897352 RepID=UPI0028969A19|nr:hypothetical protein [Nocardioides alcanivorans]